ncbi:type II toxin-antitoxin system RelE/ParE family toxin [uncultured Collinsella sp.]|uniref:type II toxin-antitoxin system RelE/ParE family toxin n=1 Tax=uncultured Collinsella sp. TaxID=165190 RepID=UPI00344EF829
MLDAYEKLVGILERTPFAFPLAVDSVVGSLGYRWARVRSYIVLYTVNEADEMIVIERVEHESRNWRVLLG